MAESKQALARYLYIRLEKQLEIQDSVISTRHNIPGALNSLGVSTIDDNGEDRKLEDVLEDLKRKIKEMDGGKDES